MKNILRFYALTLLLAFTLTSNLIAQEQTVIAPDLTGSELRQYVIDHYKTSTTLGYDTARDTLYLRIDLHDGNQLTGVYSHFTIQLDLNADPSTDAYNKHINAEHTWPQSMGAGDEPQRSDMNNLYPTKDNVNSARGNRPFDEIPDAQTDHWYYLDRDLTSIPSDSINEYSELDYDSDTFEPREDHKGNVARSIFYFYVMYQPAANAQFFDREKDRMLQWEDLDPVDSLEYARAYKIAAYQENKANPFVLDSSMARRIWFTGDQDTTTNPGTGDHNWDGLIISEVMDGNRSGGLPKYIEIYNASTAAHLVNNFKIKRAANGATTFSNIYTFPDMSLSPGQAYVITNETTAFDAVFGSDSRDATSGSVQGNGNDLYALFSAADTLIDVFGTLGTTDDWYKDSYAERKSSINIGSTEYTDSEWVITSLPSGHPLDGNTENEGTPGTHFVDQPLRTNDAVRLPSAYSLSQAYPNPFNNSTSLDYTLPRDERVVVQLFDVRGRQIHTPLKATQTSGEHTLQLNFTNLPSGIYFVRLSTPRFSESRKVLLL